MCADFDGDFAVNCGEIKENEVKIGNQGRKYEKSHR